MNRLAWFGQGDDSTGAARDLRLWFLDEQFVNRETGVEDQVEEPDHHLVPALVAPRHFFGGIGGLRVVRRVVEVGGAIDPGTLRQRDRLLKVVPVLPVPVEMRHSEKDVRLAGWKHRAVLEVLSASVHVRMQAGELDVGAHLEAGIDTIIRITRRNPERAIDGREC
jgi:hypothetical protein